MYPSNRFSSEQQVLVGGVVGPSPSEAPLWLSIVLHICSDAVCSNRRSEDQSEAAGMGVVNDDGGGGDGGESCSAPVVSVSFSRDSTEHCPDCQPSI